jgi:hypothetical protein
MRSGNGWPGKPQSEIGQRYGLKKGGPYRHRVNGSPDVVPEAGQG